MRRLILIAAIGLGFLSVDVAPSRADKTDLNRDIEILLLSFQERYGFPGATVAYQLSDGSNGTVAVGLADVEDSRAMTPESRMLAASIGKTIWGALVLSFESEGVINRDDRVSDHLGHLSWFARVPNAGGITVGHLLTHSAGLPDHVHMEGVALALIDLGRSPQFEPEAVIAFILDEPPLFEPGTAWSYSDTGYLLLGMVIESATGQNAFDLAQERFLTPLGLSRTSPSDTPSLAGLAAGYTVEDNPFGLAPRTMDDTGVLVWNPAIEWTGGGFASTASDLARWGYALFTGGAMEGPYLDRLLDAVSVHPDAPGVLYGSGIAIYEETPHGPVYGHGGWVPGYVSSLRHYANQRLTIAFQINTDVGVVDDSSDLVPDLETALADLVINAWPSR